MYSLHGRRNQVRIQVESMFKRDFKQAGFYVCILICQDGQGFLYSNVCVIVGRPFDLNCVRIRVYVSSSVLAGLPTSWGVQLAPRTLLPSTRIHGRVHVYPCSPEMCKIVYITCIRQQAYIADFSDFYTFSRTYCGCKPRECHNRMPRATIGP